MRIIRNKSHRLRDELNGVLSPRPLIPTISRRSKRAVLGGLVTRNEPMSFGYVSWMAFLVFWIVFARAYFFHEMTTKTFSVTRGVVIVNVPDEESFEFPEAVIYRVSIGPAGELRVAGQAWEAFPKDLLCLKHPKSRSLPIVVIEMDRFDTYQRMVTTIERIQTSAARHGCSPLVDTEVVGAERPGTSLTD